MTSTLDMNSALSSNLKALAERYPSLAERLCSVNLNQVQTTKAQDGGICYVKKGADNKWHALSNSTDPIKKAQTAVTELEDRIGNGIAPAVVIGLNPGYTLEILYKHFKDNYYDKYIPRRIYVIIDSLECLYGWLRDKDRSDILNQPEIEFYWHQEVKRIVRQCKRDEQRSHLFIPVSTLPERVSMKLIEPLAEFFISRQEEEEKLYEENCEYYKSQSDKELDKILAGEANRKPRLLIPSHASSTVVQYSVRDTAAMFEKEGWEVRIMHMKTDLSRWRINKNINEFKPDIYLLVNHLRTEDTTFYPPEMMFITWVQDTVSYINNSENAKAWNKHVKSKKKRRDLIIGYVGQVKEYGYQEDRLSECPMIVNQDIFKPRELTPEEKAKYECDICFASNRSKETSLIVKDDLAPKLEEYGFTEYILMSVHDHLWKYYRDEKTCVGYVQLEDKIIELPEVCSLVEKLTNKDDHDFVIQRIYWELNDVIYRHVVLEWIDEMGDKKLHLYGRGWEDHPRFAKHAKGILNHGEQISKAYNGAGRCLHLNSMEGEHQRIIEIISSNGKLLTKKNDNAQKIPTLLLQYLSLMFSADVELNLSKDARECVQRWLLDFCKFQSNKKFITSLSQLCEYTIEVLFKLSAKNLHFIHLDLPQLEFTDKKSLLGKIKERSLKLNQFKKDTYRIYNRYLEVSFLNALSLKKSHKNKVALFISELCYINWYSKPQSFKPEGILDKLDKIADLTDQIRSQILIELLEKEWQLTSDSLSIYHKIFKELLRCPLSEESENRFQNSLFKMAQNLYRSNDTEGKDENIISEFLEEVSPKNLHSRYIDGYIDLALKLGASINSIEYIYKTSPDIYNLYSRFAWNKHVIKDFDYESAVNYLKQDYESGRISTEWQLNYAQAVAICGDFNKAVNLVSAAYEKDDSLCNGYARISYMQYMLGNFSPGEALAYFEKDYKLKKLNKSYLVLYASFLSHEGQKEKALNLISNDEDSNGPLNNSNALIAWYHYLASKDDPENVFEAFQKDKNESAISPQVEVLSLSLKAFLSKTDIDVREIEELYENDPKMHSGFLTVGLSKYAVSKDTDFLIKMVEKEKSYKRSCPLYLRILREIVSNLIFGTDNNNELAKSASKIQFQLIGSWLQRRCFMDKAQIDDLLESANAGSV